MMARIFRLPEAVASSLHSSSVLPNYARIVEELVSNSVDAGASKVDVYVDIKSSYIRVEDDGQGVKREDLSLLGERHATSKLNCLDEFHNDIKMLGFRGEALSSLSDIAVLETITRARGSPNSYKKIMKNNKCIYLGLCNDMKGSGMTVVARDIFHNQPVRRRHIQSSARKILQSVKEHILQIAVIYSQVAFKVMDLGRDEVLFETVPSTSPLCILSSIFGNDVTCDLRPVDFSKGDLRLLGFLSNSVCVPYKAVQFFYINSRFVYKTPIHKLLNNPNIFRKCINDKDYQTIGAEDCSERTSHERTLYPAFVLNLSCPRSSYDITFDSSKTLVEFKNWQPVITFVTEILQEIWGQKYGCSSLGPRKQNECSGSDSLCALGHNIGSYRQASSSGCFTSDRNMERKKRVLTNKRSAEGPFKLIVRNQDARFSSSHPLCIEETGANSAHCVLYQRHLFGEVKPLERSNELAHQCFVKERIDDQELQGEEESNVLFPFDSCTYKPFKEEFDNQQELELSIISNNDSPQNDYIILTEESRPLAVPVSGRPLGQNPRALHWRHEDSVSDTNYYRGHVEEFSKDDHSNSEDILQPVSFFSSSISNLEVDPFERFQCNLGSMFTENSDSCTDMDKHAKILHPVLFADDIVVSNEPSFVTEPIRDLDASGHDNINKKYLVEQVEDFRTCNIHNKIKSHICNNFPRNTCLEGSEETLSGVTQCRLVEEHSQNTLALRRCMESRWKEHSCNDTKAKKKRSLSAPPFYRPQRKYGSHLNPLRSLSTMEKEDIYDYFELTGSSYRALRSQQSYNQSKELSRKYYNPQFDQDVTSGGIVEFSQLETLTKSEWQIARSVERCENALVPDVLCSLPASATNCEDGLQLKHRIDAWKESCMGGNVEDSILDVCSGPLYLLNNTLVPETINRDCFMQAKVLQQVDRKYIIVVAQGILAVVDQHAADERIRLEQLRKDILEDQGKRKITILEAEKELVLPDGGFQLLQNYREKINSWGWRFKILGSSLKRKRHSRKGSSMAILTAVPSILGVDLTIDDLYEYIQQLIQTDGSSAAPPAVLRILSFKACRGAIMFGDFLLTSECVLLVEELKKTSLCFQCAHGRPTTVPLVNLEALHKGIANLSKGMQTSNKVLGDSEVSNSLCSKHANEGWHGLKKHRASAERSKMRLIPKLTNK